MHTVVCHRLVIVLNKAEHIITGLGRTVNNVDVRPPFTFDELWTQFDTETQDYLLDRAPAEFEKIGAKLILTLSTMKGLRGADLFRLVGSITWDKKEFDTRLKICMVGRGTPCDPEPLHESEIDLHMERRRRRKFLGNPTTVGPVWLADFMTRVLGLGEPNGRAGSECTPAVTPLCNTLAEPKELFDAEDADLRRRIHALPGELLNLIFQRIFAPKRRVLRSGSLFHRDFGGFRALNRQL